MTSPARYIFLLYCAKHSTRFLDFSYWVIILSVGEKEGIEKEIIAL